MNKAKALLAALPMGAAILAGSATSASAITAGSVPWPSIGANAAGPALIINLTGTNTANVVAGPSSGPYDGVEDTYIGVLNNTNSSISSLNLSSATATIFHFDGDGIDGYPGITQDGSNPDTSGYGGPHGYFTSISADEMSGIVNFSTPIPAGGVAGSWDYFSLEEPLDAVGFRVTGANGQPTTSGEAPLPASWTMMLIGFAGIGFASFRATKKRAKAIAAL